MSFEPIHVAVPASPDDPREYPSDPDGVIVHRVPSLHPDDVTVVDGIPVTTVARTLIDLAEVMDEDELRECFLTAESKGLLNLNEIKAARGRVEWRASLATLDRILAEFSQSAS